MRDLHSFTTVDFLLLPLAFGTVRLPLNLRTDYNSLHGFKTNLKTHLFHQDYI